MSKYIIPQRNDFLALSGGTVTGNTLVSANLSATTIFSGSTDLSDVIISILPECDITRVQGGTNISTGGTANAPIINLNNNISLSYLSASTIFSGSTDLSNIILNGLNEKFNKIGGTVSGNITITGNAVIEGNVEVLGTATTFNTEVVQVKDNNIVLNFSGNHATSIGGGFTLISGKTDGSNSSIKSDSDGNWVFNTNTYSPVVSGLTIYSGSTDLSDIIIAHDDRTRVQGGTNINTGGTANAPTINLDDNIILNSVSANTISASTLYSGSTDLSDVIISILPEGDITRVQGGTNISTGGTANAPTINLNNNISLTSLSASTISATTITYSNPINYSGMEILVDAGEVLMTGQTVYIKSDGKVYKAKADVITTLPAIGIMTQAAPVGNETNIKCMISGQYTFTGTPFTTGGIICVSSATAGSVTTTQPTTSTHYVQWIGVAKSTSVALFNFNITLVKIP